MISLEQAQASRLAVGKGTHADSGRSSTESAEDSLASELLRLGALYECISKVADDSLVDGHCPALIRHLRW